MRTRRAASFVLAAAAPAALSLAVLCAAVPSSANVPPAVLAGSATVYKTPAAVKLHEQLDAHEKNVLLHLTGRKTLSFAELNARQRELALALEQATGLAAEERDGLTADLRKIGRLLSMTEPLARGASRLDPRLEQVMREASDRATGDPADALTQISSQLLRAAASPADAATVFDNLSRHLGGQPASKTNLDAVRADFGAKPPLVFTPADDPRTLAGIMTIKSVPPSPAAASGDAAAEKKFADDRQRQLAGIRTLAEAAERSFGGDPSAMGFDALIDNLIQREERVARNVGAGGPLADYTAIPARLAAVRKVNPQLASFMASVWLYRHFLHREMTDNRVPAGTTFKAWEVFPDAQGAAKATFERYQRDGARFAGLVYRSPDGATRYQGDIKEIPSGERASLAALARNPADADRIFDYLRASGRPDPAAVFYQLASAAPREAARPQAPAAAAAPAAPAAADEPSLNKEEAVAAQNCAEALNGAVFSVGRLCKYSPVGASLLAGLLDAVRQQFGTVEGILMNVGFMLLGLLFAAMTGGVGLIIKILFAVGMGAWAVYKLVPAFYAAIKALWNSKEGSVERYAAVRQLAGLVGGLIIMGLLAVLGGKIGKAYGPGLEAKISGVTSKFSAKTPAWVAKMAAGLTAPAKAKLAAAEPELAPKMGGESHAPEVPGKSPPRAFNNVKKGIIAVAEERAGKSGTASKAALDAVTKQLEQMIADGKTPTPPEAKAILATALEKADLAVRDHAAQVPAERANVDLAVAIVAKDAEGGSVLVSANAGDAGVFVRRGGELIRQRPPPPLLERVAAVKEALAADGLAAGEKIGSAELSGAKNLAKLAETDPVLEKMLGEAEVRARRMALRAKADPALAERAEAPGSGFDLLEYKARVAAEPAPGEALGSARYKAPRIQELALKPKDGVFAASRNAANAAAEAHELVPEGTPTGKYVRALLDTDRMRAIENARAVAELSIPEKPGFFARLASRLASREAAYGASVFNSLSAGITPPPAPKRINVDPPPFVPVKTAAEPGGSGGVDPNPNGNAPQVPDDASSNATNPPEKPAKTTATVVPPDNHANTPDGGRNGGGGSGAGGAGGSGGSAAGGGPSDQHPKAPTPGGFGDKGGAGGGGGGGGGSGAGGNGGGAAADALSPKSGGTSPAAADIAAAAPAGARPAAFA
ncbi:MAG TPA: hypothetical protein VN915_12395, partial [Elusimicrobiota bacterium]|nr:hypothetical protein [Elusimicrobiota bacterium]